MKCATDECPNEAQTLIAFPWADAVPGCDTHVGAARQLMISLGRESELKLLPIPADAPAPITAKDPVQVGAEPVRTRALELELELEVRRTERLKLELELLEQVKQRTDAARSLIDHFVASASTLVADLAQQFSRNAADTLSELVRVEGATVQGETAPGTEPPKEPTPDPASGSVPGDSSSP